MTRLRGHFNGSAVVLDDPVPPGLQADTPAEVLISSDRDRTHRECEADSREFWSRPLALETPSPGGCWRREDLHECGGQGDS